MQQLVERFTAVRQASEALCRPLEVEDYGVQSMPDVSPPKWHLAHTTWFWEMFLLAAYFPGYAPFDPRFNYLFNSYYESVGERQPRDRRGLLSRPTVAEVYRYRAFVEEAMRSFLHSGLPDEARKLVELGLNHEQQHQELLLTDILHILASNPLRPADRQRAAPEEQPVPPLRWQRFDGGLRAVGHGGDGFCFDNELPRHPVYAGAFALASRLVTAGEYLEFMADGGYRRPQLWLSDGWRVVQERAWSAPLYWEQAEGCWQQVTLTGVRPVLECEPVCHVSFYEADAFARWAGKRLPTEVEWEVAAGTAAVEGNLVESDALHPRPAAGEGEIEQLFGDAW
ncbi:MAG TPA: ergothioneine biosynthesis protein EgtB, partial [Armatimonadota bacterium]|nr:ergothioneine biosynthesis protein EgtB [Armatimonadota bacterium]